MNKAMTIGLLFIYIFLVTFMANLLGLDAETTILDGAEYVTESSRDWFGIMKTFWNLLTFQVDLPHLITAFVIYPPILVLLWYIIELVRGV